MFCRAIFICILTEEEIAEGAPTAKRQCWYQSHDKASEIPRVLSHIPYRQKNCNSFYIHSYTLQHLHEATLLEETQRSKVGCGQGLPGRQPTCRATPTVPVTQNSTAHTAPRSQSLWAVLHSDSSLSLPHSEVLGRGQRVNFLAGHLSLHNWTVSWINSLGAFCVVRPLPAARVGLATVPGPKLQAH